MAVMHKPEQQTIRAFKPDVLILHEFAREWNCSMAEVVHRICALLRKRQFEQEIDEAFDVLESNPELRARFYSELALWDVTVGDGL